MSKPSELIVTLQGDLTVTVYDHDGMGVMYAQPPLESWAQQAAAAVALAGAGVTFSPRFQTEVLTVYELTVPDDTSAAPAEVFRAAGQAVFDALNPVQQEGAE